VTARRPDHGSGDRRDPLVVRSADNLACRLLINAFAEDVEKGRLPHGTPAPALSGRATRRQLLRELKRLRIQPDTPSIPAVANNTTNINVRDSQNVGISDAAGISVPVSVADDGYGSMARMREGLVTALRQPSQQLPLAILVDDLHTIADTDVGTW